jgi:hypothetical protein
VQHRCLQRWLDVQADSPLEGDDALGVRDRRRTVALVTLRTVK